MSVLLKPLITEKMTAQGEELNRYGFVVEKSASKHAIKKAVESLYNVTVDRVNVMNYGGKSKSRMTKSTVIKGKTKAYKKAIIFVADGEEIDFYSNI